MPDGTGKNRKHPEEWVVFVVSIANLGLAAWWAYRAFPGLLDHPQWFIHLIISTALMWALIRGAQRRIEERDKEKEGD